jgi:AcrR family transcriptional regulator
MSHRAYSMSARAVTAAETRDRILDATIAIALETQRLDFSLEQVAERAGRSVQTILRRFGSRDGLVQQAIERGSTRVAAERRPAVPGDIRGALSLLVEHYEQWGAFMLRLLAHEDEPDAGGITAGGRLLHRDWVTEVFSPGAPELTAELTDLLVVATDLFTWKLLRLDRGLDAADVLSRMTALTDAVLERAARLGTGATA